MKIEGVARITTLSLSVKTTW